jgi:hypothetical protein
MRAIPCPITKAELEQLYLGEKLTDDEVAARIGKEATAKRVRSWRKRLGIRTLQRWERHDVPAIEGRLRSLLVGSMLGDGRLVHRTHATHYTERHEDAQRDYLEWKMAQWGSWVRVEPKPNDKVRDGKTYRSWRFHTVAHESLNEWQALFYEGRDRGWKRLVPELVDHVDEFALAVWYLDDGYAGWWPDITFGSAVESREVAWAIFEKFRLKPRWQCKTVKGDHETGGFHMEREDTADRFLEIVRPHVPDCMARKLEGFGYNSGRNNGIKTRLHPDVLRELVAEGVSIPKMAKRLGAGASTVRRHLRRHGIEHPALRS